MPNDNDDDNDDYALARAAARVIEATNRLAVAAALDPAALAPDDVLVEVNLAGVPFEVPAARLDFPDAHALVAHALNQLGAERDEAVLDLRDAVVPVASAIEAARAAATRAAIAVQLGVAVAAIDGHDPA